MAKLRKMLGKADSPYIVTMMEVIETQSRETIAAWCLDYTEQFVMSIYEKAYPDDGRLQETIDAARRCLAGEIKVEDLKKSNSALQKAAREAEDNPAAQAAARAVSAAAMAVYHSESSLGIAFYGAAAIAYEKAGLKEKPEVYDCIAQEECKKMEDALRAAAVENEPNPAKINWYC